jgi:hypothetical protein
MPGQTHAVQLEQEVFSSIWYISILRSKVAT